MALLTQALRDNPELALFLALALGYVLGAIRFGRFQLGPTLGVLLAGLAVGQLGIDLPDVLRSVFFLLSVFAIGFKTGPEFYRSLRSSALPQLTLIVLFCVSAVAVTWVIARTSAFPRGTAAGMLAGAMTNSTAVGTAATAARALPVQPAEKAQIAQNVATTYALTYILGLLIIVALLPSWGPLLMRVNLRDAVREYEAQGSAESRSVNSAYREVVVRAYRLPPALDNRTVDQVEHLWPADTPVVIARVRRANAVLEAIPAMGLQAGDVVAVAGRSHALASDSNPFKAEVIDRDLLQVPTVSADLILTKRNLAGQTIRNLAKDIGARGVFLTALRRGGRELPFTPSTIVERGDVMSVSGTRPEVARVADEIGYAEYPTTATDLFLVAITIAIGGLIGIITLIPGELRLSLGKSVGVLLTGLTLGHLRSLNPRFGRIPDAAVWLLEMLGLSTFLALVGIEAGPGVLKAFQNSGLLILAGAAAIAVIPQVLTILVGYYVIRMNAGILLGLCAGAGTSGSALAAIESAADSKVPSIGYGLAYALSNILMAMATTLLVMMGAS